MSRVIALVFLVISWTGVAWAQSSELQALNDQFDQLYESERYAEAIPVVQKMLELEEIEYGPESSGYAWSLGLLAILYENVGDFAKAEQFYKRSLEIYEKTLGPDHPDVATALKNLALLLVSHYYRFEEAEPLYLRALAIEEKALGPEHPEVATTLSNLAELYGRQGRHYDDIGQLMERARKIRYKADFPQIAPLRHEADAFWRYGDDSQSSYTRNVELYEKIIALEEAELGDDWLTRCGERVKSADAYDSAAESRIFRLCSDLVLDHNTLGGSYMLIGRYPEAEYYFERYLTVDEQVHGLSSVGFGNGLAGLAELRMKQGRYKDAELIIRRAMEPRGDVSGREADSHLMTILASAYKNQGRFSEAEPLYQKVLAEYEKTIAYYVESGLEQYAWGPEFVSGRVARNLGEIQRIQNRNSESRKNLEKGWRLVEKALGPEHPDVATSLNMLGDLWVQQNRYADAEPLYLRALAIRGKALGPEHHDVAGTLYSLTGLYADQGRYAEGLALAQRSTAILRQRFTGADARETTGLVSEQRNSGSVFRQHVDLRLAVDKPEQQEALAAEAFEVLQLARASGTGSAIAQMAVRFAASDDEVAGLIRDRQDLLVEQQGLEQQLLDAFSKPPAERDLQMETDLRAAIADAQNNLDSLDAEIRQRFPRYAELTSRAPASLGDTQSLLGADEALLAFVHSRTGDKTHVFVVRPDRATAYTVVLGSEELESMVKTLRAGVDLSLGSLRPFDAQLAYTLYQKLLGPGSELLADVKHLFVVPVGALQSLPFHLLVTEDPGQHPSDRSDWASYYRAVAWLAKRHALTTLPSVASLRALRQFAGKEPAVEPFIGFGNPKLGTGSGDSRGLEVASLFRGALADVDEVRKLLPLPDTEDELRDIARHLDADEASLYLEERATETMVKSVALDTSRVVAFATHGLLSGELTGFTEPALVLTPPDKGTPEDDGLLTASEVAQLKLNADWVILSACNTAAADTPGAEGLSGLAKAFFYAGARTLLVSHWYVSSDAATRLTTQMFDVLRSNPALGRAEALRQSMMALADMKYRSHPAFWAPFVVVGEGG